MERRRRHGSLVDNEFEIFGQRLSAAGGEVGANDFRISDMGPDGNGSFAVLNPAIAYNSQPNEYLVVWRRTTTLRRSSTTSPRSSASD